MPVKRSITWADVQVGEIKRLNGKREDQYDANERLTRDMAILIASFASCHSWKTHRRIKDRANGEEVNVFSTPDVREEHAEVLKNGWKQISVSDVGELARMQIPDNTFSEWLYFNVDKTEHKRYRQAWCALKGRLADYLDEGVKGKEE
jgi:hypothetical protein